MKKHLIRFLSILVSAAMLFSLSACIPFTLHLGNEVGDDDSSAETSADEDETASDEPTEAEEDETIATEGVEDETSATEPVEVPDLSTEDKVNAMYYVVAPLAYVLTYESETHVYDPDDVNFVASTLFIASSMFSSSGIFRTATWNSEGYLEVPYAEMEELGHACFSDLLDDFTSGDDYERMSYDASVGIFYVGGGDGYGCDSDRRYGNDGSYFGRDGHDDHDANRRRNDGHDARSSRQHRDDVYKLCRNCFL